MRRAGHRTARLVLSGLGLVAVLAIAACSGNATHGRPKSSITAGPGTGGQAGSRPNIVFVLTDDLSLDLVSHMPHVVQMAKQGTSLSHYYTVDSLCCPSRTAIFTGQYPHNNGVFTNDGADGGYGAYMNNRDDQRAFVLGLHNAGYRTGFMGKYLNNYLPSDRPGIGWDTWDVTGSGYSEYNYSLNENGRQQFYGHQPQDYLTDVVSTKAADFIHSAARNKQPFMLEVATFAPHKPYTPPVRYANAFPGARSPHRPSFNRLPTGALPWLTRVRSLSPRDQQSVDTVYRKRLQADLAVDDMIGHLQDQLKASGVDRNTYFVFSSDNGYHMGDWRLLPGKQTAFDTDIHVPLVVTGPGVPAGHTSPLMASNIDLSPTFLDLAGGKPPAQPDGVSLAPLWHGGSPTNWQRAVLIEHHRPQNSPQDPDLQSVRKGNPPSYEAVRTSTATYVRYSTGQQEYYNTSTDPYQLDNLAARGVPPDLVRTLDALRTCRGAAQCQAAARAP